MIRVNTNKCADSQSVFRLRRMILSLAVILISTRMAISVQMPIPVDIQWALFTKILQFDRNLPERVGDEIVIGIVFQERYRNSLTVKNNLLQAASSDSLIRNIGVRYVPIKLSPGVDFKSVIMDGDIDVLYITPLRAFDLKIITDVSRAEDLLTLTGVPEYVAKGITVGIGQRANKPLIIINKEAAKAEGVDFSSRLLKLAKVI